MSGHTQGPWRRGIGNDANRVFDSQGRMIAERTGYADGHLIAAAPELLETLICITEQLERIGDNRPGKDGPFIDAAHAAIAKAGGRS